MNRGAGGGDVGAALAKCRSGAGPVPGRGGGLIEAGGRGLLDNEGVGFTVVARL